MVVTHRDWAAIVERLGPRPELTTEELGELAEACWWLGDIASYLQYAERLHHRHAEAGQAAEAADIALRVGLTWAVRGDIPVAQGWLNRAQQLLVNLPRGPLHGLCAYLQAASLLDLDATDTDRPLSAAAELERLALEHRDKSLACFASAIKGMAHVLAGDITGFRHLDDAMSRIVGGQVDPMWAGDIYCSIIHLCEGLGDLARMRAWTDSLAAWAAPLSDTFLFAGITRVHQLQLIRAEGDWDTVERDLGTWCEQLSSGHGWLAGAGFYELGEVHRLRGRTDEARACFERARSLGVEPQPGEAQLLHAQDRTSDGLDALRIALAGATPLKKARMLGPAAELALAAGERTWAAAAAAELGDIADRYGTPGLVADAAMARAACLVAMERPEDALPLLDTAARIYREQRHQHALARVHESLAQAHRATGPSTHADAAMATARAIYQRLGAVADLARLAPPEPPAGLTVRETEVLVEVSKGLTNREVAHALTISPKTVGRHLESIFVKAGVGSRTAAAAWARAQHLV